MDLRHLVAVTRTACHQTDAFALWKGLAAPITDTILSVNGHIQEAILADIRTWSAQRFGNELDWAQQAYEKALEDVGLEIEYPWSQYDATHGIQKR